MQHLRRCWDPSPAKLGVRWECARPRTDSRPSVTLGDVQKDRSKPFVLAVDDEEHITELVAMALGYNGFQVQRAATGREPLAAVAARRPDLILLDVMLPDL